MARRKLLTWLGEGCESGQVKGGKVAREKVVNDTRSASSFLVSVLQATDGVMPLASFPQVPFTGALLVYLVPPWCTD